MAPESFGFLVPRIRPQKHVRFLGLFSEDFEKGSRVGFFVVRTESNLLFFQVPKEKDRPGSVRCEGREKRISGSMLCFGSAGAVHAWGIWPGLCFA